ncbi:hypothetical protein EJ110_NYTH35182 [Nymphaea thermarum]|nr:hypothetical protein EJ110_NYTH35182 [Nymphaea thermarum]
MEVNEDYISHFLASLNIPFNCPSLHDEQQDAMVWRYGDQKDFTRHEIWQRIRKNGTKNNDNMLVWKGRRPPRATWTVYLGVSGRLPTDSYVQNQGQSLASRCSVCKQEIEDLKHELGLSGITSLINLEGPNNGIGVPIISCKVLFGGIRKASKKKALTNAGKIVSIWRFGSFGKLITTLSTKEIFPLAVWQHNFGCTAASTGGTLIGKEQNITKFVTGFALGFLGAMASYMKIDGLISASLRGVRTTKEEWQVSSETCPVGPGLAWLAGSGTTLGGASLKFF